MDKPNGRPDVLICAWCPDASLRTMEATLEGKTVTHGCCDSCLEVAMAPMQHAIFMDGMSTQPRRPARES